MNEGVQNRGELERELGTLRQRNAELAAALEQHQALRESEERLQALVRDLPVGVYRNTPGPTGRFLMANPSIARMFGFESVEQFMKSPVAELYADPARRQAFSEKLTSEGQVSGEDIVLKRRDGSEFWGAVTASVQRDDAGEIAYFQGIVEDVDDRTRAGAALRESEQRYRSIFQSSPVGILTCSLEQDDTLVLRGANPAATEILGLDCDRYVGKAMEEAFPALAETDIPAAYRRVARDGTPWRAGQVEYADGRVRGIYEVWAFQSNPGFVVVMFKDVSEEQRMARELRQERDRAQTYLDVVSAIVVAIGRDQRVTLINQRGCELLGCAEEEVVGKNWFDHFIPKRQADGVKQVFGQIMAGNLVPVECYENQVVTCSGEERTIAWHNTVLRAEDGTITGTLSSGQDITAQRELEAHLRQQQKLESLGTLAGGVAHEINNPINGVMNYAQLILDQLGEGEHVCEYAGEIIRETERVATIVRNLLTFARQEKQEHSLARVEDIVEGTMSLIRTVIKSDRITLDVEVAQDLPEIRCRSQQIQQVLMNLVTNARDALNERYPGYADDKLLRVTARQLEGAGPSRIRLTVEDHGTGIRPETQERMFDPFFTTKGRTEGTGLGLSISHAIIREHQGELHFETEPGRYTRFYVDLPVDDGRRQGGEDGPE